MHVAAIKGQRSETATKREMLRVLREIPGLATLVPILLERGDPQGREFAIQTAIAADLPILQDFVIGGNGTDQNRLQAAQHLVEMGLLPRGKPIPLFMQGKQQELLLLDYEIYSNAQPSHVPKQVQKLTVNSNVALRDGRYADAEQIVREALKIVPDEPTLLNHLAATQAALGHAEESDATIRRMAGLYPDYLFARSAMAQLCIREKRLEEARQWIEPLLKQPRFHVSEFGALCIAQCELLIAEGQREGAQTWLNFWEKADPDNPQLAQFRNQMRKHGLR
jgi:tetratricopeptide (TPR) repeat protein